MSNNVLPEPPQPEAAPAQFAALDLGSNSFHLITARVIDQHLQPLLRFKQRVHLANGLGEDGELSDEAMQRGLDALRLCAQRLAGFQPEQVRVVATHALREASNRAEFIARAAEFLPFAIETISGREEARLIYQGVAQTTPTHEQRLVIDIGGGSTEMISGHRFVTDFLTSRSMGSVSFTDRFFDSGEITAKAFEKACIAARGELKPVIAELKKFDFDAVYATSGTAKALAHWVSQRDDQPDDRISLKQLYKCRDELLALGKIDRISISGMDPEREVIITAGTAIMLSIMEALGIETLQIHDAALREGVLYELAGSVIDRHNVRQRTVDGLAARYCIDPDQARRIERAAKQQFDKVAGPWELSQEWCRRMLWAARLHEVGLQISSSSMHHHSAYILANADMPGFGKEEQLLLATLVRCCRKKIRPDVIPEFSLYSQQEVYRLIVVLRLAVLDNIDRQDSAPSFFISSSSGDQLEVTLTAAGRMDPVLLDQLNGEVKQYAKLGITLKVHNA
ncbi:Ppx/GppA phosphatase family protein [Carnimonas bestiolae]|uniref:Ppx/GppA phosphatase family protein n=1 Tax=Carnimonas bestiolae TaxID=3402172 RepID=UPI003EDC57AD